MSSCNSPIKLIWIWHISINKIVIIFYRFQNLYKANLKSVSIWKALCTMYSDKVPKVWAQYWWYIGEWKHLLTTLILFWSRVLTHTDDARGLRLWCKNSKTISYKVYRKVSEQQQSLFGGLVLSAFFLFDTCSLSVCYLSV